LWAAGNTLIADGEWHYVAGTYDDEFLRVYVDGTLESEMVLIGEPNMSSAPITMGAWSTGAFALNGIIDEVGLFKEALTKDDIEHIMAWGLEESLGMSAVSSIGQLTTTWGSAKVRY